MKVNEKIRQLREEHNWSQEDMAVKLEMSTNGYAKLERGISHFSLSRLEQIADVFGIDIVELMSLGEKNMIFYSQESNNNNFNVIGSGKDIESQLIELRLSLNHKDEIIRSKDLLIDAQKSEITALRAMLEMYQKGK